MEAKPLRDAQQEMRERRYKRLAHLKRTRHGLYRRAVEVASIVTISGGSLELAARVEDGIVSLLLDALDGSDAE